jgi:threonylcarbamoyladenosine tRNA methylthiotransferase MtaB
VGADLIAGFPTEDEVAHADNLSIIGELGIVHGHIFPYSARHGTPAARMPQLPRPLVSERAAELRNAVAASRAAWLESLIGQPQTVLAERDGTGHAENFARIALPTGTTAGQMLTITPTRITEGLLS